MAIIGYVMKFQLNALFSVFFLSGSLAAFSSADTPLKSANELAELIRHYHRTEESIGKRCSAYDHIPLVSGKKMAAKRSAYLEAFALQAPNSCSTTDLGKMGYLTAALIQVQDCLNRLNLCGYVYQEYEKCSNPSIEKALQSFQDISESCRAALQQVTRDEL